MQEETVFSRQQLNQQLTQLWGETLDEGELDRCLALLEIVEPPSSKEFWQAAEAKPGIYIILAGKCRLLDSADNLITTLCVGESFGER
jgi:hypothetical protein